MTDHVNCAWCPNGGNNPRSTGEICESCAEDLADELEGGYVE